MPIDLVDRRRNATKIQGALMNDTGIFVGLYSHRPNVRGVQAAKSMLKTGHNSVRGFPVHGISRL